jgi:multidrug resistance efflux pump
VETVVTTGQVLATLDDRDLRLERAKWASQQEQLVRQYHQAMATRNAAQVVILAAQIDQARAELALVEDRLGRTKVTAPFAGVVVSGDLTQMLGAPVEQGQVLFEVAPLEHYRLVLQIDERDVAKPYDAPGSGPNTKQTGGRE